MRKRSRVQIFAQRPDGRSGPHARGSASRPPMSARPAKQIARAYMRPNPLSSVRNSTKSAHVPGFASGPPSRARPASRKCGSVLSMRPNGSKERPNKCVQCPIIPEKHANEKRKVFGDLETRATVSEKRMELHQPAELGTSCYAKRAHFSPNAMRSIRLAVGTSKFLRERSNFANPSTFSIIVTTSYE